MKLSEKEWEPFFISSLFKDPKRGKRIVSSNHIEGDTPLVSSAGDNNGVTAFIGNREKVRIYENCLSIANGGSSAGKCFYEPFEFIASDNITHCKNEKLTANQYLAIASVITSKLTEKYSFCREITDLRISREKIMLPVDDAGKTDFEYLEKYVKDLKGKLICNYLKYAKSQISNINNDNIDGEEEKDWDAFFIGGKNGIFKLSATNSGIDKNKLIESDITNIPYITRSDVNNGLSMFVGKEQRKKYSINDGNVIIIGLDTQTAFYQPHQFYTGQNVQILTNQYMNKYNALFIIPLLKKQLQKLNWGGNGATLGRLERMKIMLPINTEGDPDYKYMEQYIKNIMIKKYKAYLEYADK